MNAASGRQLRTLKWTELRPECVVELCQDLSESFDTTLYCETFPTVFSAERFTTHYFLVEGEERLASVAATPLEFSYGHSVLGSTCLGSVCVPRRHRGRGYAQELLLKVVDVLRLQDMDFLCLFATESALYEKVGFRYLSDEYILPLSKIEISAANPRLNCDGVSFELSLTEVSELGNDELSSIWRLMCRNGLVSESLISFREFLVGVRSPGMKVLQCRQNHRLDGVLFYEKGADFPSTWHGLVAGQPATVAALLGEARRFHEGSLLHVSESQLHLIQELILSMEYRAIPSFMIRTLRSEVSQLMVEGFHPFVRSLQSN